jgi:small conductance mechanosensitive channel
MIRILMLALAVAWSAPWGYAQEKGPDPAKAVTAEEPAIEPAALSLLLLPLTVGEVENEIAAWQGLLQKTVSDLAGVQFKLRKIAAIEDAEASGEEPPPGALVGPDVAAADKEALTERAGDLLAQRSALLTRFEVVLKAFEKKGGDPAGYRRYAKAVSGIKADWKDPGSIWKTLRTWAFSEEGGVALAKRVAMFAGLLVVAYLVGVAVSWLLWALFRIFRIGSKLLRRFMVQWSRRIVFVIGAIMGLSALGLNITPLLAAIGATGFVVGFALQNTLSNFASGILIMTQHPFDVGDTIEAAGVSGSVDRVSLFSTHITTFDNSKLVVPNNTIWSSVISNSTAADTKRLDLIFDIKPPVTVKTAEEVLMEAVSEHPKVLKEPLPVVRVDALTEEGFRLICWPWVKTADAGEVRGDIVREAERKLRADLSREDEPDAPSDRVVPAE